LGKRPDRANGVLLLFLRTGTALLLPELL
jgi:hypothetical protein